MKNPDKLEIIISPNIPTNLVAELEAVFDKYQIIATGYIVLIHELENIEIKVETSEDDKGVNVYIPYYKEELK